MCSLPLVLKTRIIDKNSVAISYSRKDSDYIKDDKNVAVRTYSDEKYLTVEICNISGHVKGFVLSHTVIIDQRMESFVCVNLITGKIVVNRTDKTEITLEPFI